MTSAAHKRLASRNRRRVRVRARIIGSAERPRLSVFRSPRHISAQLIDDATGKTLVSLDDSKLKKSELKSGDGMTAKVAVAYAIGKALAGKAKAVGIERVVFDRGGYLYHGRVKALAEGAREGGLEF